MRTIQVFISYNEADYLRGADPLVKELTQFGFEVYSFRHKPSTSAQDFNYEIKTKIEKAQIAVVLWSAYASKSQWVEKEIALAKYRNKIIILVLLDNIEKPSALVAREDGIRAFGDDFGWTSKVAEKIMVDAWRPPPPSAYIPYGPRNAPKWLTHLKAAMSTAALVVMAGKTLKDRGIIEFPGKPRSTDRS